MFSSSLSSASSLYSSLAPATKSVRLPPISSITTPGTQVRSSYQDSDLFSHASSQPSSRPRDLDMNQFGFPSRATPSYSGMSNAATTQQPSASMFSPYGSSNASKSTGLKLDTGLGSTYSSSYASSQQNLPGSNSYSESRMEKFDRLLKFVCSKSFQEPKSSFFRPSVVLLC
jgi:hypothetical protein